MSRLQKMLWAAERPIVLLGGSRWSQARLRGGCALCRAICAAGRDLVPPRASLRSRTSLLCRRSRHRPESEAARAREGRRPHPPGRRPAGRDALAGLHAPRHSGAAADLRARLSRASRSSAASTGRILAINATPTAFAAALEGLQPPNELALARRDAGRACRFSRLDRQADRACPARSISARSS